MPRVLGTQTQVLLLRQQVLFIHLAVTLAATLGLSLVFITMFQCVSSRGGGTRFLHWDLGTVISKCPLKPGGAVCAHLHTPGVCPSSFLHPVTSRDNCHLTQRLAVPPNLTSTLYGLFIPSSINGLHTMRCPALHTGAQETPTITSKPEL